MLYEVLLYTTTPPLSLVHCITYGGKLVMDTSTTPSDPFTYHFVTTRFP